MTTDRQPSPSDLAAQQRRGVRLAILMQCCNSLAFLSLANGQALLYFNSLGISSIATMILLALPALVSSLTLIPFAYLTDNYGLKRVGRTGNVTATLGFAMLPLAYWATESATLRLGMVATGVLVYSVGSALFNSGWFVLAEPLIPAEARGRFWGKLRFSWQLTAIVFAVICLLVVRQDSPAWVLVCLMAAIALAQLGKTLLHLGIPVLRPQRSGTGDFFTALRTILQRPGYLGFGAYVFLMTLFTAASPTLFALIEKQVLKLSDSQVLWAGGALMLGSVAGYLVSGPAVDRFGMRRVFIVCHIGYGLALVLFPFHGACIQGGVMAMVCGLNFAFAFMAAASSVAISTEMMGLAPEENKSLAISVLETLRYSGGALSSLLSAAVLKSGMLKDDWTLLGVGMSAYDSVLLGCALMVVLCVVTLGLVPSILHPSDTGPSPQ